MTRKPKHSPEQYKDYAYKTFVIETDYMNELSEFEQDFLLSVRKKLGRLSEKQIAVLDKILKKFFD